MNIKEIIKGLKIENSIQPAHESSDYYVNIVDKVPSVMFCPKGWKYIQGTANEYVISELVLPYLLSPMLQTDSFFISPNAFPDEKVATFSEAESKLTFEGVSDAAYMTSAAFEKDGKVKILYAILPGDKILKLLEEKNVEVLDKEDIALAGRNIVASVDNIQVTNGVLSEIDFSDTYSRVWNVAQQKDELIAPSQKWYYIKGDAEKGNTKISLKARFHKNKINEYIQSGDISVFNSQQVKDKEGWIMDVVINSYSYLPTIIHPSLPIILESK